MVYVCVSSVVHVGFQASASVDETKAVLIGFTNEIQILSGILLFVAFCFDYYLTVHTH